MCGSQQAFVSLLYGEPEIYEEVRYWSRWRFFPTQPSGLFGCTPRYGYSGVYVPGKSLLMNLALGKGGLMHMCSLHRLVMDNSFHFKGFFMPPDRLIKGILFWACLSVCYCMCLSVIVCVCPKT
ncbi:hypothetical protein DPMN_094434 [Dreissena polymorpha]|uniref:Uncharacterized protein n=1 Tax=Dreissena polymorpha TaxID=45954 RepID=A0A9D4L4R4_DREPO|nr:hypothetical protein DPMN_094434 [Dreissena polymorpha]